jgi:hypothetical protein
MYALLPKKMHACLVGAFCFVSCNVDRVQPYPQVVEKWKPLLLYTYTAKMMSIHAHSMDFPLAMQHESQTALFRM